MIVGEEDSGASVLCGVGNDLAQGKFPAALVTLVRGDVEAPGFVVDMSDPQMLAARVLFGETAGEEFACGSEAVELQRKIGTLVPHER
jgi:hypothetical protein